MTETGILAAAFCQDVLQVVRTFGSDAAFAAMAAQMRLGPAGRCDSFAYQSKNNSKASHSLCRQHAVPCYAIATVYPASVVRNPHILYANAFLQHMNKDPWWARDTAIRGPESICSFYWIGGESHFAMLDTMLR